MNREEADRLVKRMKEAFRRVLKFGLVGPFLLIPVSIAAGMYRWPGTFSEFLEQLELWIGVPLGSYVLTCMVAAPFLWWKYVKYNDQVSGKTDIDIECVNLWGEIDRAWEGDADADIANQQVVLRGEIAKARSLGADPMFLAAYIRRELRESVQQSKAPPDEFDSFQEIIEELESLEQE